VPESSDEAYSRGHTAGEIAEQLRRHETHFAQINGSIADSAKELEGLRLAVQRLADQAEADAKTRVSTAAALKAADEARRLNAEQKWSPFAQAAVAVGALGTIVAIVAWVIR
jgi:hypothetical protein